MDAIVRKGDFDQNKLDRSEKQMQEFDAIHTAQRGYRGNLVVDAGNGNRVILNLWESEAHANAALGVMMPAVQRLIEPFTTGPGEIVGTGDRRPSSRTRWSRGVSAH